MMSPNIATSPPTLSEKSDIASIPVAFYSEIRDFLTTRFMISLKMRQMNIAQFLSRSSNDCFTHPPIT